VAETRARATDSGGPAAGPASGGASAAGPASDGAGATLFIVATPIGNLGDVTLRALEVLRAVPLIAAEDTRISRRLLARYEIPTRTVSFHAKSAPARTRELLDHLRAGADLAVVTDAGTPGVSDPGEELVAAWAGEGGRVVPVPGASAVLAAVAASGVAGPRWGFEGFLPRSGRERKERLARVAADDRATVVFEAPGRLGATLRDLAAACGEDRAAAVCRELTKLHEQIVRGTLGDLHGAAAEGEIPARGEVVIVVAAGLPLGSGSEAKRGVDGAAALAMVDALVRGGASRAQAAKAVAAATGVPRRTLYQSPPNE
jgi:16S rRNA (cytidine1402-2'-O)-methyltransferase